jgi:hypothetical protein
VSFAARTLCVASQRAFIVVNVYFVIDSVRKLLDKTSNIIVWILKKGLMFLMALKVRFCSATNKFVIANVTSVATRHCCSNLTSCRVLIIPDYPTYSTLFYLAFAFFLLNFIYNFRVFPSFLPFIFVLLILLPFMFTSLIFPSFNFWLLLVSFQNIHCLPLCFFFFLNVSTSLYFYASFISFPGTSEV